MSKRIFLSLLLGLILSGIGSMAQVFTNYNTADGLPSNNVNGVAIDMFGTIWFATDAGVASYNNSSFTVYTTANGIVDNYINCIAVDVNNHIWIGTDYGVSTFNGTNWNTYTTANGLTSNMISFICGTNNGDIWVGTNNGISRLTGTGWINYTSSNGLPGNMISYIRGDLNGNVWIGTWLTGLAKFDGTSFTYFTTAQQLVDNNILSIAIDKQGNKWLGTYAGITVLDSLDQWKINYKKEDGLFCNYVQDLAFDHKNVLWAGIFADYLMDGTINVLYQNNWWSFGVGHGLVNVQVKRIAVDVNDNLWIATGAGVSKLYVNNLGYNELKDAGFNFYPNPASDKLYIDHTGINDNIGIYDLCGRILNQSKLVPGTNTLDISNLEPGSYLVEVTNGKLSRTVKFIKY